MKLLKFYKLGREAGGRRLEVTLRLLFSILCHQVSTSVYKGYFRYFRPVVLPSSIIHPF
ncbi:hypothetical protein [Chryseobacterium viscerum]|uniref:hypothetical protein n=1 Tax=Chryseobacterium viscerum TaxID=1037377 RepID=UPI00129B82EC|nr:hypothetical protein [Chryseobacterium viscerum]